MPNLPATLRTKLNGAGRVAVLVLGSRLRGDDAAGLLVADALDAARKRGLSPFRAVAKRGLHPSASRRGTVPFSRTAAKRGQPLLKVFRGETAPENLTGPIKALRPTHLVVIDAADFGPTSGTQEGRVRSPRGAGGLRPGTVRIVEPGAAGYGASFSTHNLPVEVMTEYLRQSIGCAVVVLGIQPGSCEFGREPSGAIRRAAQRTAAAILKSLA